VTDAKVGATLLTYNLAIGKAEQVQHVWVNHDLVDVRVQTNVTPSLTANTPSTRTKAGAIATVAAAIALAVALGAGGQTAQAAASRHTETIHTTASHPWLTADRGWVDAGNLLPGELVATLSVQAATVAWVHVVLMTARQHSGCCTAIPTWPVC
jgi:hypothetical protein